MHEKKGVLTMKNYSVLFWDIDDTLLDFQKGEQCAFEAACSTLHIPYSDSFYNDYHEINEKHWKLLELGKTTREILLVERFKDLFELYHIDCDPALMEDTYRSYLDHQHQFMPYAFDVLQQLQDMRMCIVTNGRTNTQKKRYHDANLDDFMENLYISEQMGLSKPNPEFLYKVMEDMNLTDSSEILLIGDSLSSDILGGNNAGIDTVWYNPHHKDNNTTAIPTYEIDDLRQLVNHPHFTLSE